MRAAEMSGRRGRITLERFGQAALPVGAVVDGQVADADVVAAAMCRRAWAGSVVVRSGDAASCAACATRAAAMGRGQARPE